MQICIGTKRIRDRAKCEEKRTPRQSDVRFFHPILHKSNACTKDGKNQGESLCLYKYNGK